MCVPVAGIFVLDLILLKMEEIITRLVVFQLLEGNNVLLRFSHDICKRRLKYLKICLVVEFGSSTDDAPSVHDVQPFGRTVKVLGMFDNWFFGIRGFGFS